jgi:hypothetical protein
MSLSKWHSSRQIVDLVPGNMKEEANPGATFASLLVCRSYHFFLLSIVYTHIYDFSATFLLFYETSNKQSAPF